MSEHGFRWRLIVICLEILNGNQGREIENIVVNLYYAGDTLIFGKEDKPQAMVMKLLLKCYKKMVGTQE